MSFMDIHYWFRDHGYAQFYAAHLDDSTRGYAFTFQLS